MFISTTTLVLTSLYASAANAYWLMGSDLLTSQRLDPIVVPNRVSGHVHGVIGGSNFGFNVTTAKLRESECTTMPVKEDFSNYWFPKLYFHHADGFFSSIGGGSVVYYLFGNKGDVREFPDDFRMITGNPTLRAPDARFGGGEPAVTFLCLDFSGKTTNHTALPVDKSCPSGIRAQINFPSCWDGVNLDSPDHISHVAYLSNGADSGECQDPKFPVRLPRIFVELYWSAEFNDRRGEGMNPKQPYVFSHGDPTGYGYHADFFNGWKEGVLQKAIDGCTCDIYGSPQCCADKGIFTFESKQERHCKITNSIDEPIFGKLDALPGYNPVQDGPGAAKMYSSEDVKPILSPVYVYDDKIGQVGAAIEDPSPFFSGNGGSLPGDGNSGDGSSGSSTTTGTAPTTTKANGGDGENPATTKAQPTNTDEVTSPTKTESASEPTDTGVDNGSDGDNGSHDGDDGSNGDNDNVNDVPPSPTNSHSGKGCRRVRRHLNRMSQNHNHHHMSYKRSFHPSNKRASPRMSYD